MRAESSGIRLAFAIALMGLWLTACLGKSPQVQFYSLQPVQPLPRVADLHRDIAITVGPVAIPSGLDRPQIVTRDAENNLHISEYHRWAGRLPAEIASVIAKNLGNLLGTDRVTPFTTEDIFQPTHRIVVNIDRFDGRMPKDFLLEAAWSIKKLTQKQPLVVRKSNIREPLASPDYDGLVAAQNKALAALSTQMAEAFRELPAGD